MKKVRCIGLLLIVLILASSCKKNEESSSEQRYQATFLTLFDTVTTIIGYAESEVEFRAEVQAIYDELYIYHQLYDIYNEYEGLNNLKTINDNAGVKPVEVDSRIIDMLLFAYNIYNETDGAVNVAMGSVLSLWHEARENGINNPETATLPIMSELEVAANHIDMEDVIIDKELSTVFLQDPAMSLDVGAIAKGYAVECVSENSPDGYIISVGGNVSSTSAKPDGSDWVVGLQKPEDNTTDYSHTVYISKGAVVTSGDYQRYYIVDGIEYNHIIDPKTLLPATKWKAVSVVADNSSIADGLSTALFILDREEGQALLNKYNALAMVRT